MSNGTERIQPFEKRSFRVGSPAFEELAAAAEWDRKHRARLRRAAVLAVVLHAALFTVASRVERPMTVGGKPAAPKTYLLQQVRFQPPPPRVQQQQVPPSKRRKIPVPDPTPDDPEPVRVVEDLQTPDVDLPVSLDAFLDIPGPPGPPSNLAGVRQVEGDVLPPVKVYAPAPTYTEEARAARVQGVVILQAIIDAAGEVSSVKVLKGLPMNLTEQAMDAVQTWRFEPATLGGEPVPVYYNLTISFSLQ